MRVKYVNVFRAGQKSQQTGSSWDTPQWAQICHTKCNHRRVEMRIDGHWLKPPVGMRADQASHEWLRDPFEIDEAGYVIGWRWELVPR